MVAFDHIRDMNDISLKPWLLRSLIREHLPDQMRPVKGVPKLSYVMFMVKTYRLLSESSVEKSNDPKVFESWKAAVDSWVDRLLMLASSDMPDKCWTGLCLLGVTCQECSSERFLASYSIWLQKLLFNIQTPADSQFVKMASCASLSDLFTRYFVFSLQIRLGSFPRVKKDANSQAIKVVQPVLKLLNEDSSEAVLEGAVCLLSTFINFFPSSISRFYNGAETAVVSKIMSGDCSQKLLEELGDCLALLPKSRGDEDSWSLMMQKILLSINVYLNDTFQGVEEESKSNEIIRLLVPPGKDPPPPLGYSGEVSEHTTKRPELLQISTVSTLMRCCCTMLTRSYPVQVKVPVRPLVTLARRVLMVDGSLSQALLPFVTSMQQERICSELPLLHLCSLDLLNAVVKGVCSQLLPHAAEIVLLLTEYFTRCALPDLRIKVYSIIRILLMSMGVGVAVHLSEEVIKNAIADLESSALNGGGISSSLFAKPSSEVLLPFQKKRKHESSSDPPVEQADRVDLEAGMVIDPAPISVKIAALEALEAFLTVGGTLGANSWRPSVDYLLINVATHACKGVWAKEEKHIFLSGESATTWADFQLAALGAVLASLLSPSRFRSPILPRSLELFHRGTRGTRTKLTEFCAHALRSLEMLIHPRALSLFDLSSRSTSFDDVHSKFPNAYSYEEQNSPVSRSNLGKRPVDFIVEDDDLYKSWLAEDEHEIPATDPGKDKIFTLKPPEITIDPSPEKISPVPDSQGTRVLERSGQELASASAAQETEGEADEAPLFQYPAKQGDLIPAVEVSAAPQLGAFSESGASVPAEGPLATHAVVDRAEAFATGTVTTTTSRLERSQQLAIDLDSEASMESLPDIVDADPDSD
ncbi:uncharacterized protein LOC127806114 isoform X2 [Diospyros lotus]|uniref:uncharacterized protein LOC127806114 isoform X2 n=1 Tax=Diospyros lotus TaxID=55363 RepID=UPI00224E6B94|nr:uncharacterized protein LOC127806114 isoform X2 [Diospyros lotus]